MISSNPEEVEIILGYVRSGYGWKFPKSNAYNIGIGGEMKKNKDILTAFREFTRSNYQIEPSPVPPKGGFLFTGRYVKKPYLDDEILLLGDAAGLTEPVTGEGIYFALRSAQIAVESIHDYFTRRTLRLGTDYRKRLHSIHRFFRQALFMQRIFFIPPVTRLFMRHIRRRNRIAAFYADHTLSVIGLDYFRILPAYIRSKLKTIKKKHNIQ
jgi:flavin-dependent dehydrogenase